MNITRRKVAALAVTIGAALTGCTSTTGAVDSQRSLGSSTSQYSAGQVSQSTETTAAAAAATATPLARISETAISDCVAYVTYGAFTGNPLLAQLWNEAGQDEATMRANCEVIGQTDPANLDGMARAWQDIEAYVAGVEAAQVAQAAQEQSDAEWAALAASTNQPAPQPVYQQPSAPSGASAICNDGTFSYSQNRRGTCSHHGGVAIWL